MQAFPLICLADTSTARKALRRLHSENMQSAVKAQKGSDKAILNLMLTTKSLSDKAKEFENLQRNIAAAITKDERQRMCFVAR